MHRVFLFLNCRNYRPLEIQLCEEDPFAWIKLRWRLTPVLDGPRQQLQIVVTESYLNGSSQLFSFLLVCRQYCHCSVQEVLSLREGTRILEVIGQVDAVEGKIFCLVGIALNLPHHGLSAISDAALHFSKLAIHLREIKVSLSEICLECLQIKFTIKKSVFLHIGILFDILLD